MYCFTPTFQRYQITLSDELTVADIQFVDRYTKRTLEYQLNQIDGVFDAEYHEDFGQFISLSINTEFDGSAKPKILYLLKSHAELFKKYDGKREIVILSMKNEPNLSVQKNIERAVDELIENHFSKTFYTISFINIKENELAIRNRNSTIDELFYIELKRGCVVIKKQEQIL